MQCFTLIPSLSSLLTLMGNQVIFMIPQMPPKESWHLIPTGNFLSLPRWIQYLYPSICPQNCSSCVLYFLPEGTQLISFIFLKIFNYSFLGHLSLLGSKITTDGDCSHEIKRRSLLGSYYKSRQHIKEQRHYFANKGPSSQGYGFSSSHVQMWELDNKKGWAPKNWCFLTVVLEKTLESPLDCKEIQPVNPKGNQSWIFIGRTDAKAEAPILWPPDVMNWLIGKDPDAGKDWRQEEKGTTEDEMVG